MLASMRRSAPSSLKLSITTSQRYGSSAPSVRNSFSRSASAAKKRSSRSVSWSTGYCAGASGSASRSTRTSSGRLRPVRALTGTMAWKARSFETFSRCGSRSPECAIRSTLLITATTVRSSGMRASTARSPASTRPTSITSITTSVSRTASFERRPSTR